MNEKEIIIFFSSILFINIFVKILKRILKQKRPIPTKTYGMPSSKSSVMTFILVYLLCIHKYNKNTIILIIIITIVTILIKYWYQEHSLLQLIFGSFLGLIIGLLSYYFSEFIF